MRMNWLNLTLWGSFPEPDIFTFISSPKAQVSFSFRLSYVRPSICLSVNFSHLIHWINFKQTWHKTSMGEGVQVSSTEKPRPFPWKIIGEKSKRIAWRLLENHWPNCTKHPWVKEIQVCSNEGPRTFLRVNNNEIAKIPWRNFKKRFSPEPLGKCQPDLAQSFFGWSGLNFF